MKIWMPPQIKEKNHYSIEIIGGIAGIVLLALLLVIGSSFLMIYSSESKEIVALLLCLFITIFIIWLAIKLGRRSKRNTTLFCMEQEHLYIIDVSKYISYHKGLFGHAEMVSETAKRLEEVKKELERDKQLPAEAAEIIQVDNLREHPNYYSLVCKIKNKEDQIYRWTYLMMKGYENEEELRMILERKRFAARSVEIKEERKPLYIFIAAFLFILFVLLCVLSHPYVQFLSDNLYFPFLGLSFLIFCITLYLFIKWRRGE